VILNINGVVAMLMIVLPQRPQFEETCVTFRTTTTSFDIFRHPQKIRPSQW